MTAGQLFGRLRNRLRALFRSASVRREMAEEMRLHVELESEHLMRSEGLTVAEARRRALVAFGGVDRFRELGDASRGVRLLQDVSGDFRHGARALMRSPGFTIAAVFTLGLGIGAATTVFSIVHGVLLRPLPFASPDELVSIREVRVGPDSSANVIGDGADIHVSLATYRSWRDADSGIPLTAYVPRESVLTGGEARVAGGAAVSANFFELLGVALHLGRTFTSAEDATGAPRVVVLGYDLWRTRYAADAGLLGSSVEISGVPHTVVGVAAAGFAFPEGTELWTPLQSSYPADIALLPQLKVARVLGRLSASTSGERAAFELSHITAAIPGNGGWAAVVEPLHRRLTEPLRTPLLLLFGAVLLVLFIACVNVGHLLLARGSARRHELAVRAALGAGRLRLVRQLLTESMMLAGLACGLGILCAWAARDVFLALNSVELPPHAIIRVKGRVLLFAAAAAATAAICTGVVPALRLSIVGPASAQSGGGAVSGTAKRDRRSAAALVVAEVCISVVLLVSAGLLIRSFIAIISVEPGFDADRVTAFELRMPAHRYSGWAEPVQARSRVLERIGSLPGVEAVSLTHAVPFAGSAEPTPILVEGREQESTRPPAIISIVAPGFFDAMGIPVIAGRDFEEADASRGYVAIVNESFARAYFPDESAIGRKAARLVGGSSMREIVGVVADVRHTDLTTPVQPIYYTFSAQEGFSALAVIVRSDLTAAALTPMVRMTLRDVDSEIALARVIPLSAAVARSTAGPRFYSIVLGMFAALALLFSAIGLYSMLSEQFTQRRREFGVRLTLGAAPSEITRLVLRQGVTLVAAGLALGFVAAAATTRLLVSLLFGIEPLDGTTYVAVAAVLILTGAAASAIPALRAARTDPITSLRPE